MNERELLMQTILQIKVDETVLHGAETYAKEKNLSISELVGDYLLSISQSASDKKVNEINSYHDLLEALDTGMDDIKNGRTFTHEEMKGHWDKRRGQNTIV